jgi:hypothetical protein
MHPFRTKVFIFMLPLLLPIGVPQESGVGGGLGGFVGADNSASGSGESAYLPIRPMPAMRMMADVVSLPDSADVAVLEQP